MQTGGVAFSAYANTATTLASTANTKVTFDVEEYDTNNAFSSSRFTAPVAGYYQINASVFYAATVTGALLTVYKNDAQYKCGNYDTASVGTPIVNVNTIVDLNVGDYVEIQAYNGNGSTAPTQVGSAYTYFNGALVAPK